VTGDTSSIDFWLELESLVHDLREQNAWDAAARLVAAIPNGDMNLAGIGSLRVPLLELQSHALAARDPVRGRLAKLQMYYGWLEALDPVYARGVRVRVREGAACGFGGNTGTIQTDVPTLGMRQGIPYSEWSVWFDDPPASPYTDPPLRALDARIDARDLAPMDAPGPVPSPSRS
jgi:hypothetical protein